MRDREARNVEGCWKHNDQHHQGPSFGATMSSRCVPVIGTAKPQPESSPGHRYN